MHWQELQFLSLSFVAPQASRIARLITSSVVAKAIGVTSSNLSLFLFPALLLL